jgi:hypothetical protein
VIRYLLAIRTNLVSERTKKGNIRDLLVKGATNAVTERANCWPSLNPAVSRITRYLVPFTNNKVNTNTMPELIRVFKVAKISDIK